MSETGVVGLDRVFGISPTGSLSILGEAGMVDWWIGAEDRWHVASREVAVRQSVEDHEVVAETRVRVPGGDVVSRVYAVPHGSEAVAVMEIENRTQVPVAIAIVVSADGPLTAEGDTVCSGGRPVLRASRSIARCAMGPDVDSLLAGVEAGEAIPPAELGPAAGANSIAAVFPLPHTATVSAVLSLRPVDSLPSPADLPSAEAVDRGWESHTQRGTRVEVADALVERAVDSARRHLLIGAFLGAQSPFWSEALEPVAMPLAAAALELWGHPREASELMLSAVGSDDLAVHASRDTAETGALLWSLAERMERRSEPDLDAALVPWVQEAAIGLINRKRGERSLEGDAWRAVGLASAASVLSRTTDDVYAQDFVDALPELVGDLSPDSSALGMILAGRRLNEPSRFTSIDWLATHLGVADGSLADVLSLASASGAIPMNGRLQHPLASALLLISVRMAVVDEPEGAGGVVALLPRPEESWLGAPVEAHNVPVTGGSVSFAVRWHGTRPAMLWDLQVGSGSAQADVSSPWLDPGWRDHRPQAETLLAETPTVELADRPHRGEVGRSRKLDADEPPDSFG